MEVGEYVRTKDGIIGTLYGNYAYDENQLAILTKSNENGVEYTQECSKNDIIKSSPNIIDLIEVGDYVNGYYVEDIRHRYDGEMITILEVATGSNYFQAPMYEDDIKSIVTKEQFSSMEYKI